MNEEANNTGDFDVFGSGLLAYYFGAKDTRMELISDSDKPGAKPMSEKAAVYFQRYGKWGKEYREGIDKFTELMPEGKILDVGCASGRFLKYFRSKGYQVEGIDVSPGSVWICRHRGFHARVLSVWDVDDGESDAIILLGHNLGIGGTREGVERLFSHLGTLVKQDGLLLTSSVATEEAEGQWAKKQVAFNRELGRSTGETIYQVGYRGLLSSHFPWIYLRCEEVEELAPGWTLVEKFTGKPGLWAAIFRKN